MVGRPVESPDQPVPVRRVVGPHGVGRPDRGGDAAQTSRPISGAAGDARNLSRTKSSAGFAAKRIAHQVVGCAVWRPRGTVGR